MAEPINTEEELPVLGLVPSSEERNLYRNVHVTPEAGIAYSFNIIIPATWHAVKLPVTADSGRIGTHFVAIGVFSPFEPPIPPVVLSIGARVAPPSKSVASLFREYCDAEQYEALVIRPQRYAVGNVIEGLVRQQTSPLGPVKMRLAMFEDGGRLFGLSGMAPPEMYPDFVRAMSLAMLSFELTLPQGPQLPLFAV